MTARASRADGATMAYLKREWGDSYELSRDGDTYTARAITGRHDVLTADSPAGCSPGCASTTPARKLTCAAPSSY